MCHYLVLNCNVFVTIQGVFTIGVRDSSVESLNTILVIEKLNLLIVKILCYTNTSE